MAVIEGRRVEGGPKLPLWLLVFAALPMGLVAIGRLFGFLAGGAAFAVNQQVARSALPRPLKILAMLAITAAATFAFLALALLLGIATAPLE